MPEFMFSATLCVYESCNFDDIPGTMCCEGKSEMCCVKEE